MGQGGSEFGGDRALNRDGGGGVGGSSLSFPVIVYDAVEGNRGLWQSESRYRTPPEIRDRIVRRHRVREVDFRKNRGFSKTGPRLI